MDIADCKGDWALVTGASSGIGREFAVQLAAAGLNLVLVARRKDRLEALSTQLTRDHGTRTVVAPLDLARADAAQELRARLDTEGVRVRLLCNNAAFGRWGPFERTDVSTYRSMLELDVVAVVEITRLFIDDLTSFPSSAIVNVSSPAALQPVPYMAVYAAAKSFVHSFSQALYGELASRGVLVQAFVPAPTATEFDAIAGAYDSALKQRAQAADVVRHAVAHLRSGEPVVRQARGTYKQQLFAAAFPARTVISTVARMFQPPRGRDGASRSGP